MNKKNAFTLIELLAVIAVLAILVILAIPNIIKLFEQSRQNTFINEVKNIYRTTEQQIMVDALSNKSNKYYANYDGNTENQLDLSGNNIKYCVTYDNKNNITYISVSNDMYSLTTSNINGLKITELNKVDKTHKEVKKCSSSFDELNSYTRLEYIESVTKDKQYIDTEYKMKKNTKIVVEGMVVSGDTAIFGARNAQDNIFGTQRYTLQYISSNEYRLNYKKTEIKFGKKVIKDKYYKWVLDPSGLYAIDEEENKIILYGSLTNESKLVDSEQDIYLMCINDKSRGGAYNFGQVRIYSFSIYEDDKLIKELIPVLDSDGVACMHDSVERKFYYNQGLGLFNQGKTITIEK